MTAETHQPPIDPRRDPALVSQLLHPNMTRFAGVDPETTQAQLYQEALQGLEGRIDQLAEDPTIWHLDTSIDIRDNPRIARVPFKTRDGKGIDDTRGTALRIIDKPGEPRKYELDYLATREEGAREIPKRMNITWSKGDERVTTRTPELVDPKASKEAAAAQLRFFRVGLHQNISQPKEVPITFESQKFDPEAAAKQGRLERAAVWAARVLFRQKNVVSFK
jgi:hypothetical protein